MVLKDMGLVPLIIDIDDNIIKPLFAKEGDYRSRGISLQILDKGKEIDTTGIIVEFFAKPRDGKVYVVEATPVDTTKGKYEIVYPSSILQPGVVQCEIRLVKMTDDEIDEIITTKSFNLKVYETIADEDIFEGIDIEPIVEILVQAARNEEERIQAENERIQAENTRIQNENERKSNEQIRQQKEDERQQNEITRQTNEQTRQQNEHQRIDLYNALKDLDVSQYELRLQKLEHDTSVEEFILEEAYGPIIPLPSNATNGQINEIKTFGNTEAEEDNVKSTVSAIRLKSVGKNLFDGKWLPVGTRYFPNVFAPFHKGSLENTSGILKPIRVQQGKSYSVSCTGAILDGIYWYDENGYYINRVFSYINITPPNNAKYMTINIRDITNIENVRLQIEANNTTTEFEDYKESTLYIIGKDEEGNILELRSLPNGVKDEIRLADGKAIIRTSKLTIDGTESGWQTQSTSNQKILSAYISVANLQPLAGDNLSGQKDSVILEGFTTGIVGTNNTDNINTVNYNETGVNLIIDIALERLETPDISGFKKWLGEKQPTLIYQLAEPIEIPVEVFGNLQSYEKGTIYVDTIIPRVDFYTSEGIVLAEDDVPIKEIDSLYLVNKENGLLTPLDISKAFIFPDGKGLTHPDSYNDALVDWDYVPDVEGTNPTILMKLPTNLKASVTSTLQGVQELSNKTKKLDTRVIANQKDIYNLKAENSNIHKAFREGNIYFAHRGFSGYYPENTILSINKAQQYGFKGVEVDVRYTLDGDWVLMHDSTVDRTTNGTGVLSNLTTNYIKSLEIDGGNGVEFLENTNGMGDKKVPFLYEALEVCNRNGLYLQIEIKSSGLNYIDDLLSMIEDYNMVDKVFIISSNYSQLEFIRNISDKFMLMYVVDSVTESIINDVYALGNCGISANYNSNSLNVKDLIKKCHNKNIVIGFWTVNSLTTADDLVGMGADFITTDTIKGGKYIIRKEGYTFQVRAGVLEFRKDYGGSDCTIEIINDANVPLSGDNAVRVIHAVPFEGPINTNNGQAHASSNFAGYHTYKIEVFTKSERTEGFTMVFRNRETGDVVNPNNLPNGYWCNVIVLGRDRIN